VIRDLLTNWPAVSLRCLKTNKMDRDGGAEFTGSEDLSTQTPIHHHHHYTGGPKISDRRAVISQHKHHDNTATEIRRHRRGMLNTAVFVFT